MYTVQTEEEFREEAIVFFRKNCKYLTAQYSFDILSMAFDYVKNNDDFRHRDRLEASILVTNLKNMGFIEFVKDYKGIKYHSLTQLGIEYVNEVIQNG